MEKLNGRSIIKTEYRKLERILRKRFGFIFYSLLDIIRYVVCCHGFKRRNENNKLFKFWLAKDHLHKELDVVSIIRNIRYVKLLMKVLFNTRERKLFKTLKRV